MLAYLDYSTNSCYGHLLMKIGALLPHLEVFGGVRRYLEIGNELQRRGYHFTLFHPEGSKPEWFDFKGETMPLHSLAEASSDIGLCSEFSLLPHFEKLRSKLKFFYFVLAGHRKEKEVIKKDYLFLGNSEGICRRLEKKYHVPCLKVAGGVNPEIFYPLERKNKSNEFRILCYGRLYRKRKGIQKVIRAVERLHKKHSQLRFIFFDTLVGKDRRDPRPLVKTRVPHDFYLNLPQNKMAWLYSQADIFVSAERRAGWSNTTAEAMACQLPVVCSKSGTQDFAFHNKTALVVPFAHPWLLQGQIKRLLKDEKLRHSIGRAGYEKMRDFTWSSLADRLESVFKERLKLK
jgi:glycosyltransferase involved in cell wall biosynthesis